MSLELFPNPAIRPAGRTRRPAAGLGRRFALFLAALALIAAAGAAFGPEDRRPEPAEPAFAGF